MNILKSRRIIQFKSVELYEELPNGYRTENLGAPDHTAIVYRVIAKLRYELDRHDISGKRYVIVTEIDLNNKVSGKCGFIVLWRV